MKKVIVLLCCGLLLAACATKNTPHPSLHTGSVQSTTSGSEIQNSHLPHSEAKKMVEEVAVRAGKDASAVTLVTDTFLDFFHAENVTSYQFKIDGVEYPALTKMEIRNYLDGWVGGNHADGPTGYSVEYARGNIVCKEEALLQNREILEKISDDTLDQDQALLEDWLNERKYQYTFTCAEKPIDAISVLELNFDAFGGGEHEPAWNLYINQHILSLSISELEEDKKFFLNTIKKTQNGYSIEASSDSKIVLQIEKKACNLYTDPETSEPSEVSAYSFRFDWEGNSYTGCGNEIEDFYTMGRFGKISSFLKKTGIEYSGKVPTDGEYYIYMKKNLIQVQFLDPQQPDNTHFIIFRRIMGDNDMYWNGAYEVDPEVCERFSFDDELMDFGAFYSCPRG